MSLRRWYDPDDLLNSLCAAIQQGTHGLLRDLSIDLSDPNIVVWGTSRSYYGVQLALHVAQQFSDRRPEELAIQLLLTVDEHSLTLTVPHVARDDAFQSLSTDDASCRPELTMTVSA